jgi:N-acetyl-anhydromuramyl-L-alanine amidase AmpD
MIVVHCAATPPKADIGVKEITRWHRERGFLAIGYHWVIRRDGTVEPGRREDLIGAHAVQVNDRSVGVCLVGGVDAKGNPEDNFTPDQMVALKGLLDSLAVRYPGAEVLGHRDIPGVAKACPSFDVRAWLNAAR